MVFKSRAALERYIKALLIEVPAGAELTGEAEEIVTDLINHHPKAAEKTGAGIKKIVVRPDQIWKKNKQFWIVRQDGTEIDFSYRKCLHGEMSRIDLFRRLVGRQWRWIFNISKLMHSKIIPFVRILG